MARADPPVKTGLTWDEYLEAETSSPVKHELVDGHLFMMAGASERHNRVALNLAALLLAESRDGSCRVFMADMKLRTPDGTGYYPDVMVVCDDEDAEPYYKRRPCLIAEILLGSTEAVDRGEKLHRYLALESLQGYLLVSQDAERAELYRRDAGGFWRYELAAGGAALALPCLDARLEVSALYAGL
jgi:Uma2 family endonuclease